VASKLYFKEDVVYVDRQGKYGCLGFFADIVLTIITGGLWLIYIFVREMRRR
jgi:hypothetical protein